MKRTLIVTGIALLMAAALPASAQVERKMKHPHHGQVKQHHGEMMKQLNLTDGQKAQAKANKEAFKQKMQELNKNEGITVKEYRDRKEALRKEQKAQMQNLLTPDQKTKLQQLKTDQSRKREEAYARHLDKMKTRLQLSEAQVAKIKANRETMHEKMISIKQNESLSREERKEKMMAIKKERREQMDNLLTKEQKEKMSEMKKKHGDKNPVK